MTREQRQAFLATVFSPATMEIEKSHITAFARAIGDPNPLWNDERAARKSRYGGLIAPPTFARMIGFALRPGTIQQTLLPGSLQVDGGTEWEYFEPIRPGDRITVHRKVTDVYERHGAAGPLVFITDESSFTNQFGEIAVIQRGTAIRYSPKPADAAPASSSVAQDRSPSSERRRPYWDDVLEGEEIPPLRKCTTTQDLVRYAGASRDFSEIHYDKDFALSAGLPGVILHGALKAAYLGQMITDWIGEDGTLAKLGCQHRGMDFPGGVATCRGRVARKYGADRDHLLDCEIWLENGPGRTTAPGWATVSLPAIN